VPLIPKIRANPTLCKVYLYLVDHKNGGLSPGKVADRLGIGKSNVTYYIKQLEQEGYIKPLRDGANPKHYAKGPRANILDKAIFNLNVQIDAGSVELPSSSNILSSNSSTPLTDPPKEAAKETYVPEIRAHVNGKVIFEVVQTGDFRHLHVPDADGDLHDVPFLDRTPKQLNGVKQHHGKVNYRGQEVSIAIWESEKVKEVSRSTPGKYQLFVWPPEKIVVPGQCGTVEDYMMSQAQDVANHIAKHGGWQFGLPRFLGRIEYASQDPALIGAIPESVRTVRKGNTWIDESLGKGRPEVETNEAETADVLFGFRDVVKDIKTGQTSIINRTYRLEMTVDKMLELIEKLTLLAEKDAELNAKLMEKSIMGTAEKVITKRAEEAQDAQAAVPERFDGVMYG